MIILNSQSTGRFKNELQNRTTNRSNEHLAGKLEKENENIWRSGITLKRKSGGFGRIGILGEQLEEQIRLYRNEQQLLDEARNSLKKKSVF